MVPPRYPPPDEIRLDPTLELAEGEELVAGRRPVEEAFVARRTARRLLVVPQRRHALEQLVLHATSLRIPVVEVEGGTLTSVAGFDGHQGIALVVDSRRWSTPGEILARAAERETPPLVLVLDSLEDPQNLGTLMRTAEASGVHGAVFPTRRQAPLSPAAVKASAGAVEHLLLAPVDDLPGALADLHARGLRIVGADGDAPLTARDADLRGPIAIVVGSEGRGLGAAVRRRCDLLVRIPMHGRIESLNAAVAGSILLYEAAAQRRLPEATPTRRTDEPGDEPGDEPESLATDASEAASAEVASGGPEPESDAAVGPTTEAKAPKAGKAAKVAKPAKATKEPKASKEPKGSRVSKEPKHLKAPSAAEEATEPVAATEPAAATEPVAAAEPAEAKAPKTAKAVKPPKASKEAKPAKPPKAPKAPRAARETPSESPSDDADLLPGEPAQTPPEPPSEV